MQIKPNLKRRRILASMRERSGWSVRRVATFLGFNSHSCIHRYDDEFECYRRFARYLCFLFEHTAPSAEVFMAELMEYAQYTNQKINPFDGKPVKPMKRNAKKIVVNRATSPFWVKREVFKSFKPGKIKKRRIVKG